MQLLISMEVRSFKQLLQGLDIHQHVYNASCSLNTTCGGASESQDCGPALGWLGAERLLCECEDEVDGYDWLYGYANRGQGCHLEGLRTVSRCKYNLPPPLLLLRQESNKLNRNTGLPAMNLENTLMSYMLHCQRMDGLGLRYRKRWEVLG